MAKRLGFGELLGQGARAVSKYTGTVLTVFVAQSLVAAACMLAIAIVLAQTFSHLPLFDEAVDGDLVALIWSVRYGKSGLLAVIGIIFSALLFWQLAAWFLVGGLTGVLAQRPEGRGDTARCFGASGASTYLAYLRLWLLTLPGWVIILFVFLTGMGIVLPRIERALTLAELFGPLILASLPALLLLHFQWTVIDYARVELTLRHESHDPGAFLTYVRSIAYVIRHPITLLHSGFGWFAFFLVTIAYAYLAAGHPMYGAEGAITLFLVRQFVSLLRLAIKTGILAGQVELGRTRPLPPRRVEVRADVKG